MESQQSLALLIKKISQSQQHGLYHRLESRSRGELTAITRDFLDLLIGNTFLGGDNPTTSIVVAAHQHALWSASVHCDIQRNNGGISGN